MSPFRHWKPAKTQFAPERPWVMCSMRMPGYLMPTAMARHRDQIADGKPRCSRAGLTDNSGNFVPQNHGFAQPYRAEAAVVVIMQVGPAYATLCGRHTQLARAEFILFDDFQTQVFSGMRKECFHS